ncbi:MAG: histidine kinase [Caulobacteraceae bacterium]|nr:histidine kinase [Caulobacteraceae bacterium]
MTARTPMSLRLRVLAAIALVVVLGAAGGLAFAGWLARQTLRAELQAAMDGGRQTVSRAFEDLPRSDQPEHNLRQLIATFDGNRHVSAVLYDAGGRLADASRPPPSPAVPPWFAALLDPRLAAQRIAAPGGASLVLTPAPQNDVGDAWRQFGDALAVLGLVGVFGAGLVYVTIGQALRPLRELSGAFGRVGSGDYDARVTESGPAELVRLARRFNSMAGDLAAMRRRTRLLEEQILKLQDEERAELARDLHDEIGPHLFAVNIDAAMLGQSLAAGRQQEAAQRVKAIQTAVGHMQRQVRDILSRLRPAQLVELGLDAAIGELVQFWRSRRPDIAFTVELAVDEAALPDSVQETVYRIVQEGLSNAVRHGQPARIEIAIRASDAGDVTVRVADDGIGRRGPVVESGFGLVGMRERVEAVGGSLSIQPGASGGWSILARAPLAPSLALDPGRKTP